MSYGLKMGLSVCHTWEEHMVRMVENMAPRKIYGPKWRK